MLQPAVVFKFVWCALLAGVVGLLGCGGAPARLPVSAGVGPNPALPPPDKSLIPTVNVVSAKGWPPDGRPVAAELEPGQTIHRFIKIQKGAN